MKTLKQQTIWEQLAYTIECLEMLIEQISLKLFLTLN